MGTIRLSDGWIDLDRGLVHRGDAPKPLSPIEHRLLRYLARQPGEVVDRDLLMADVWQYRTGVQSRTIDSTLRRLRAKIEVDPSQPVHLVARYGHGVRLDALVESAPPAIAPAEEIIGREAEAAALDEALGSSDRLVLVHGPVGVGKSRLVVGLAARRGWPRVDLAGATDRKDVVERVADALAAPPARIGEALRAVPVLVLDGCDRVVEVVGALAPRWLAQAPTARVLATSRRPLGSGERVVPLGPLPIEDAIALFCERAQRHDPRFRLGDGERADLIELLDAVDRLPFAVERLAVRTSLGVRHLARMLDRRLELLGDEGRAAIEGSMAGLSADLRDFLAELAVFEGSFSAEEVGAVLGVERAREQVLELCARSLARADSRPPEPERHALYELVREAAREASPLRSERTLAHATWFARLGDSAFLDRTHQDPEARVALARAEADLRAVVDRMWERAPDLAGQAAAALLRLFVTARRQQDGEALLQRLEALRCSREIRGTIAILAYYLEHASGSRQTLALANRGLMLSLDPPQEAHLRVLRAWALGRIGQFEEARRELDRCDEARLPTAWGVRGLFYRCRGNLALQQDRFPEAEQSLRIALAIHREAGDLVHQANVLQTLASIASASGEWEAAEEAFREALAALRTIGSSEPGQAATLRDWARMEICRGRSSEAERHLDEAERLIGALGGRPFDALLMIRAFAMGARGRLAEGIEMLEERLRSTLSAPNDPGHLWTALADLRYRAGDIEGATASMALALDALTTQGTSPTEYLGLQGLIEGHRGEIERGRERIASALAALEAGGRRANAVLTRAQLALFEARFGSPERAVETLERARAEARALGMGPEAEAEGWIRETETHPGTVSARSPRRG